MRLPLSKREVIYFVCTLDKLESSLGPSVYLLVSVFSRFLPSDIPSVFTPELVHYIVAAVGSAWDLRTMETRRKHSMLRCLALWPAYLA
jgi:hypothetical protein